MLLKAPNFGIALLLTLLIVGSIGSISDLWAERCPVQRADIKMGNDSAATEITLEQSTATTIEQLAEFPRPKPISRTRRFDPAETTYWTVNGVLTDFALEDDSDYHLVVRDERGKTLIAEIPDPACVRADSPFYDGIENARRQFEARYTPTRKFRAVSVRVELSGIGMFDPSHGQNGAADNDLELHPVLNVSFGDEDKETTARPSFTVGATNRPLGPTAKILRGGIAAIFVGFSIIPCLFFLANVFLSFRSRQNPIAYSALHESALATGLLVYLGGYLTLTTTAIWRLLVGWDPISWKTAWFIVGGGLLFFVPLWVSFLLKGLLGPKGDTDVGHARASAM